MLTHYRIYLIKYIMAIKKKKKLRMPFLNFLLNIERLWKKLLICRVKIFFLILFLCPDMRHYKIFMNAVGIYLSILYRTYKEITLFLRRSMPSKEIQCDFYVYLVLITMDTIAMLKIIHLS